MSTQQVPQFTKALELPVSIHWVVISTVCTHLILTQLQLWTICTHWGGYFWFPCSHSSLIRDWNKSCQIKVATWKTGRLHEMTYIKISSSQGRWDKTELLIKPVLHAHKYTCFLSRLYPLYINSDLLQGRRRKQCLLLCNIILYRLIQKLCNPAWISCNLWCLGTFLTFSSWYCLCVMTIQLPVAVSCASSVFASVTGACCLPRHSDLHKWTLFCSWDICKCATSTSRKRDIPMLLSHIR